MKNIEKSLIERVSRNLSNVHEVIHLLFQDQDNCKMDLIHLDDMNIHGDLVIQCFKYCNNDIEIFKTKIRERNMDMITHLNNGNIKFKVIHSGAYLINSYRWKPNKKKICPSYIKNRCSYGLFCFNSHPTKLNNICHKFLRGECIHGNKCIFKHTKEVIEETKEYNYEDITNNILEEFSNFSM